MPLESVFTLPDDTEIEKKDEKQFRLNEIIANTEDGIYVLINFKEGTKGKTKQFVMNNGEEESSKPENVDQENQENEEMEEIEEIEEEEEGEEQVDWSESNNNNSSSTYSFSSNKNTSKKLRNKKKNNKNFDAMPPPISEDSNSSKNNPKKENKNKKKSKFNMKELSDNSKYQLIERKGDLKIYLYKSCNFTALEELKALSFMVVGETGCGKTTLLNSFVNSLLGVDYQDNFRFKIISENTDKSQAYSQTTEVNYYNIRSVGGYPPIKIIDTPGFGDTKGIKRDKEITSEIKKLFEEKISTLNGVCFVTKSSNNRLTLSQKYILSSILDLFGEDVKEIFVFMLTFCDGGEPNILGPLKEKDCPFNKIISLYKNDSWYYKFNNSAIFESNRNNEFTKMFWELGMNNFNLFKEKLKHLPRKSLQLSRQVLEERKALEEKVSILTKKLKVGINKIEEIKGIIKMILELKGDISDSKNYTKVIKVPGVKKIDKDPDVYATTCLICTKTCHATCLIKDDERKDHCSAMDSNGNCMYCPKKCRWQEHKNRDYILEDIMEDKTITLEDLKKRFYDSKNQLSMKKQLFNGAREELVRLNIECLETQECITKSINHLHEIALNKSVFESAEEHLDLLIEMEKSEHKPGWQARIEGYLILKEEKKMLREVYQGTNVDLIKIREFVEKEVNKYFEIDIDKIENLDKDNKNCIIF